MAHPAGKGRQLKRWLSGQRGRTLGFAVALLAGVACATLLFLAGEPGPASAVPAVSAPALSGGGAATEADAVLFRTMREISNNRPGMALTEIDKAIRSHPNFRLAHLIKGDLLLARARPLTTIGNAPGAPRDQLDDLREEARARLARHQYERPRDRVPRYLIQLEPRQRHALLVDTAKSTLYVFENHGGEPRYVADYYITIGKNGIDKARAGDNRTPLGVYHVTDQLSRKKLNLLYGSKAAELYGAGAFPINYPNEWDHREGRNGYGIWLHGVPYDTYSRAPRASNGCVALTNDDLETLAKTVQIGLTPVIIANTVEWVAPAATKALRSEISQQLESWRSDWESLDTGKYLTHYAPGFNAGKTDLAQWSQQKHKVNTGKTWIKVKVDQVSIMLYPGRDDLAVVTFHQDYASSNLASQMRKRQYWIRENGAWRILHEGAA
jgi:murein L,D-transpeptidase YafK